MNPNRSNTNQNKPVRDIFNTPIKDFNVRRSLDAPPIDQPETPPQASPVVGGSFHRAHRGVLGKSSMPISIPVRQVFRSAVPVFFNRPPKQPSPSFFPPAKPAPIIDSSRRRAMTGPSNQDDLVPLAKRQVYYNNLFHRP